MTVKIIGAGYGRTGTLSLKYALEQLGFDACYHMLEVRNHPEHVERWRAIARGEAANWDNLFAGYQATVDWPSCNYWREQLEHYPQAKVILTERDSDAWYKSVMNTIYPSSIGALEAAKAKAAPGEAINPKIEAGYRMAMELIWDGVFDGRMDDAAHVKAVFEAHNANVKASVPADQLLVYRPGDGWEPLCRFLGVPVPPTDYPKVNSTEDFQARMKG